ncbi:hypothetical protein [Acinetobacter radioresistens]|uniref:hypothetical protein n=1 Tax=Acinetobacter radioresistens TaxID=40216 RepID=UPI002003F552|nr:hypothetical protein [Acinetobacter radioresistens]MCK4108882.1 hypothetical protein [Acinetobacter radioresistens]
MDNIVLHQGSEAAFEFKKRLAYAQEKEAQNLNDATGKGEHGAISDQWLNEKNQQMNDFLKQLERQGIEHSKFGLNP